jgi:hypothetical protein
MCSEYLSTNNLAHPGSGYMMNIPAPDHPVYPSFLGIFPSFLGILYSPMKVIYRNV